MFFLDFDATDDQTQQGGPTHTEEPGGQKPPAPAKPVPAKKAKAPAKKASKKAPAKKARKEKKAKAEVKPGEVYATGSGKTIQDLVHAGKSTREALIKAVAKTSDNAEARVNLVLYKLRKSLKGTGKEITRNDKGIYHIVSKK